MSARKEENKPTNRNPSISPEMIKEQGLTPEIIRQLAKFPPFDSDISMRDFIGTCKQLSIWLRRIPEASSIGNRVRAIIFFYSRKRLTDNGEALDIFLKHLYSTGEPFTDTTE